jgi:hypothetical protein
MIVRVYIKTDEMAQFEDISNDVVSIGQITERLDESQYNVGTYRVSDFTFTVYNRNGRYSEAGTINSIFISRRTETKVKITYSEEIETGICGFARCGYVLCGEENDIEKVVFEGIIADEGTREDIQSQSISFRVLGNQALAGRREAPTISAGQSFETILTNCLTTAGLTVESIALGNNQTIDAWVQENVTCKTVIDQMLEAGNAVLAVIGDKAYIENRNATKAASKTFYGQASTNGVEDIIDISQASNGLNKMSNLIRWEETSLAQRNVAAITKYGVSEKTVNFDFITNSTKQTNILSSIVNTIGEPKREFDLKIPLSYENIMLNMLDVVKVDYPTPLFAPIGQSLAIYGIAVYGQDYYPFGDFSIQIDPNDDWKINARKIDFASATITLSLRLQ